MELPVELADGGHEIVDGQSGRDGSVEDRPDDVWAEEAERHGLLDVRLGTWVGGGYFAVHRLIELSVEAVGVSDSFDEDMARHWVTALVQLPNEIVTLRAGESALAVDSFQGDREFDDDVTVDCANIR